MPRLPGAARRAAPPHPGPPGHGPSPQCGRQLSNRQCPDRLSHDARGRIGPAAHHGTWGPDGSATTADDSGPADPADLSPEPSRLAAWTEFHEQIGALPDEEREVFDLLWYQGLSQAEAAELLGVSERTVKRRWQTARYRLHEALGGEVPE